MGRFYPLLSSFAVSEDGTHSFLPVQTSKLSKASVAKPLLGNRSEVLLKTMLRVSQSGACTCFFFGGGNRNNFLCVCVCTCVFNGIETLCVCV